MYSHLKVRKALALAINVQEILDHVMMGEGERTAVPYYFQGEETYDPAWELYPYDPEQAKRLLTEAGYPNGFGREIDMWLYPSSGRPESPDIGQAVSMYREKIGIKTKIHMTEYPTFRPTMKARNTAWKVWVQGYKFFPEPIQTVGAAALSTSANLLGGVEDKRIDALYYKGIAEPEEHKRAMIERELGQLFYDNYWDIPICTKHGLIALGKRVGEWPIPPNTLNDSYLELITHAP